MAINPYITYPSETTPEELAALKKHEQEIIKNLVVIMMSVREHYEWVLDTDVKSSRYFKLRCAKSHEEVLSKSISEIKTKSPEDLVWEAKAEHAKAAARAKGQVKM